MHPQITLPKRCKYFSAEALTDTGAQMVVISPKIVQSMGLSSKNIIPVKMKIKAANMGGLTLLGGVLVKISGKSDNGVVRSSQQLAYVAKEVERVYLSKRACQDLGIIAENFPKIDAFPIDANKIGSVQQIKSEINDFKPC